MAEQNLEHGTPAPKATASGYAADLIALCRAALEGVNRVLRASPEVRESRLLARWPIDLEDVLMELEPTAQDTDLAQLTKRLGTGASQLKSALVRLQRMGFVESSDSKVTLTAQGRQKLARLEAARASVLRRLAARLDVQLEPAEAERVLGLLSALVDRTEEIADNHHRR